MEVRRSSVTHQVRVPDGAVEQALHSVREAFSGVPGQLPAIRRTLHDDLLWDKGCCDYVLLFFRIKALIAPISAPTPITITSPATRRALSAPENAEVDCGS